MKTHLSHILPVHEACEILGHDVVHRMVVSLLSLRGHQQSNSNNNGNSNGQQQQERQVLLLSNECQTIEEEIEKLIEALYFRLPENGDENNDHDEKQQQQPDRKRIPSRTASGSLSTISEISTTTTTLSKREIQDHMIAWQKRWTCLRPLALDKPTLLHFVVPQTVQPHAGPSGHQGLFDCWAYALQGHAPASSSMAAAANASYYYGNNSSSNHSGGGGSSSGHGGHGQASPAALAAASNSNMVWLPDVMILLAVVQQYRDFRLCKDKKRQQEQQYLDNDMLVHNQALENNDNSHNKTHANENGGHHHNYEQDEQEQEEEESPRDRAIVWTMAQLAFIIYDSYQKKGTVTRDTIHRFLTDVYGEDSYKEPSARLLLDEMFRQHQHNPNNNNQHPTDVQAASPQQGAGGATASNWLHASLNQDEFCRQVLHTIQWSRRSHLLLDWMSVWMCAMIPTPEIPPSVAAYLDTMEHKPRPICSSYMITEGRLFEVKRRFHSMVRYVSSPTTVAASSSNAAALSVIQGDNNNGNSADESAAATGEADANSMSANNSQHGSSLSVAAASAPNGSSSDTATASFHPKHAVSKSAFMEAVSHANEEMGSGGYLPPSLAALVFHAGCRGGDNNNGAAMDHDSSGNDAGAMSYWALQHVLQFGCMAVRRNTAQPEMPDIPLLRFLFAVFQLAAPPAATTTQELNGGSAHNGSSSATHGGGGRGYVQEYEDRRILTRNQVQAMLLLLIEHAEFRLKSDGPHRHDAQHFNNSMDDTNHSMASQTDEIMPEPTRGVDRATSTSSTSSFTSSSTDPGVSVDKEICHLLGIVPAKMSKSSSSPLSQQKISLKKLVDATLAGASEKDSLTFEEFCEWSTSAPDDGPSSRLGYLMMDLRLIAAVLFGIPPTMASMEVSLIAEIERRHRSRYPQTTVSRRGPRGTVWYIIDAHWFKEWSSCVKAASGTELDGQDGRNDVKGGIRGLERIDNAGLLADNGSLALRADIRWKHDYEILPPLAWYALQAWYDGGPPIYRTVVRYVGGSSKPSSPHSAKARIPTENEIELYPYFVTVYLCDAASRGEARPFQQNYQLSRVTPVGVMLVQLCKELDVDADFARLWVMTGAPPNNSITGSTSNTPEGADDWILNLESNIVEQRKMRSQTNSTDHSRGITLLLELKDPETKLWPRGVDGKEWAFRDKNESEQVKDLGDGVVGLYNMGNTCYLNSSIQCISHTPIFREYFTSKAYLNDINTTNPLGYQGHLAQVSAVLINSLWKPFNQTNSVQPKRLTGPGSYVMVNAQSLTPKTFKESLGKFNELFSGNEQHDAQELLTFLLAGLSEDLNRIVEKPYIEAPDSDGRPDRELADIWWANHLRREMSIVVALFTGQYKNLLTCRTCKYESARFEPFATLTVPLPEDDHLTAYCILYPLADGADTLKYCLRVRSDGNLHDVLLELARVLLADEEGSDGSTASKTITEANGDDKENGDEKGAAIETDPAVIRRAQNLAVVDMRDGYIFKIAPNSWSLQDLQNKDTGDLPQLHVYELDNVPDEPDDEKMEKAPTERQEDDSTNYEDEDSENEQDSKFGFLAIVQRRSEVVSRDYLHPLAHRVFGTPLLVRMVDMETWTGRQLYDMVARRLRNIVPKTALRFLADTTPVSKSKHSSSADDDKEESSSSALTLPADQLDKDSRGSNMSHTTTDMEEVSAGSVPRYGFRLRVTTRDGRRCLICPWYKCCIGCLVPDDYAPAAVMNGDSVVVDWHFAVDVATSGFGLRSCIVDPISAQPSPIRPPQRSSTVTVKNHSSCGAKRGGQAGVITLEECLDAFAKEERIPEAFCSKCKDFRVQTTRMTLWRLPPILIIHLKRFQFTQTMRRKLRDLVIFPLEGLDLSRIMAVDGAGEGCRVVPDAKSTNQATPSKKPLRENGDADDSTQATTESTEADGIKDDKGRSEMLYDLYGVVHHQGALSGGHYVASLKSELDGQWRLFNDAQIYEIRARDVVDSSAYILFYIRRDMIGKKLSDLWNVRKEGNLTAEDMDQLLKGKSDRCIIS